MADQKIHVLLVDDEVNLTEFLRLELEFEGYQITVAMNGSSALIAARTEPTPDLLVLDWNLSDFTGIDICRKLRSTGIQIPVLMLTGHGDVSDRVMALDAGVDDYLVKPFSIEELLARLRALQRRTLAVGLNADSELL
jgi:DNA-binding response OmpR family regulator